MCNLFTVPYSVYICLIHTFAEVEQEFSSISIKYITLLQECSDIICCLHIDALEPDKHELWRLECVNIQV